MPLKDCFYIPCVFIVLGAKSIVFQHYNYSLKSKTAVLVGKVEKKNQVSRCRVRIIASLLQYVVQHSL